MYEHDNLNGEDSKVHAEELARKIHYCKEYQKILKTPLDQGQNPADSPCNYLGYTVARVALETKGFLSDFNKWRLYWVWGGGLLTTAMGAITDDFFNHAQARQTVHIPDEGLGHISWILYFARAAINVFFIFKHTINGSWLSPEERALTWQQRLSTQWNQYKYALANDVVWGAVNLVCFFWLAGSGALGYAGNALISLLVMYDMGLKYLEIREEQKKFEREQAALDEAIAALRGKHQNLKSSEEKNQKEAMDAAQRQIAELEAVKHSALAAWEEKKHGLKQDLAYSASLVGGWTVSAVLFPVAWAAPSVMMSLGLVGAVFCFVTTVMYHFGLAYREISKINRMIAENGAQVAASINGDVLTQENHYLQQCLTYQYKKLARATLIDAMIPLVVFTSLVFLPSGIGLGVLGAALLIMVLSKLLIKEPKNPSPLVTHSVFAPLTDRKGDVAAKLQSEPGYAAQDEGDHASFA